MDQWLENITGTIRPTTLTRYQGAIRIHINPHLGGKPITQVTGKDVQKLYDALASHGNQITGKGLASSTIRGIHSMLHEALDAAKQAGLIPWNPTEEIPTLLAPGDRDHILSGVFNQFLSALTEPVE